MPSLTLLTDRVNYNKDIELVRDSWLRDLFSFIGLDVVALDGMHKRSIIDIFKKNKIELIYHNGTGMLRVKYNGDVVGEWGAPAIKVVDEDGILYNELSIEYWSVIDKQLDIEE